NIKEKYNFEDKDISFIRDHMRVAMGLNPKGDRKFDDELNNIKSNKITHPIVTNIEGHCEFCEEHNNKCTLECKYEDPIYRRSDKPIIVNDKCLSCGYCVSECDFGAIADKIEFIPLIDLLKDKDKPVYATIAPAAVGQFGENVSMG